LSFFAFVIWRFNPNFVWPEAFLNDLLKKKYINSPEKLPSDEHAEMIAEPTFNEWLAEQEMNQNEDGAKLFIEKNMVEVSNNSIKLL
jgi:hypothetical protein